jgi:capsular exopolysaccharide synthesis family protein
MAGLLGALVGVMLAFLAQVFDRRIREAGELERLAGSPLLGIVPLTDPNRKRTPEVAEAFKILRAGLVYFNLSRKLRAVAVCSPLKGEGKTTVATNLATALARAGWTVIVVDADMRHPQVAPRLGVSGKRGLGDVLVGACGLDEALTDVEVREGRLRVLPSGRPPPNPSELIASREMRNLLEELRVMADLVVIDTPPTLQVGDAIALLDQVSGVLVVGRLGETTRDAMRRMISVVETAGGDVLGVVATATKAGLYGYGDYGGYAYEAHEPRSNGRSARARKPKRRKLSGRL